MGTTHVLILMICSIFLLPLPLCYYAHPLKSCNFVRIYNLGDSISDTGNFIRQTKANAASAFARLPYGESFFKNATGRCSDGLLMIDYIALAAGLPFLNPHLNTDANFSHGANFAVAGATALPMEILASKNISSPLPTSSLSVQLDWMFTFFNSTCYKENDCVEKLRHSLFMLGEIGGNDYNYAFNQGKSIEEVKSMVPEVVQFIMDGVRRVISFGAVRVVVPGNFPIGCRPIYLTEFNTNDSTAFDENHCLIAFNNFSLYHNALLQKSIDDLKQEYPNTIIVYGDYYNAFLGLLQNASNFGFDSTSLEKACCGIGGDYNYNLTRKCGAPGVPVCPQPNRLINWDGMHLTQEAYRVMAGKLIDYFLSDLQCTFSI